MNIRHEHPENYAPGIYRVEITLDENESKWLSDQGTTLNFTLPKYGTWSVRSDRGYRSAFKEGGAMVIGGTFSNGRWAGEVQTNGVTERENQTPVSEVLDALHQSAANTLAQMREMYE